MELGIYSGATRPAATRILPVALVLDTHGDLEFGVHFLDLDFEIGQELFALLDEVVAHPCAQLQDLGLWCVAIDIEN